MFHHLSVRRDVKIYRLISKSSIEEAMLRCGEKKLKLEMDVTGSGQKGRSSYWSCYVFSPLYAHNFTSMTDWLVVYEITFDCCLLMLA